MNLPRPIKAALLGVCLLTPLTVTAQSRQGPANATPAASPAQQATPAAPQAQPAPAAASPQTQAATPAQKLLKPEELERLVAPIALYPDNLLALVLMASTYPVDLVQADRWIQSNKKLKSDPLKAAVGEQPWDDSVESLVPRQRPCNDELEARLDSELGEAVVGQQPDVMDAIQRLRAKADANNKLASTKRQKVADARRVAKRFFAIEPSDPDMLYVPYYDPAVVYGSWPYAEYPPYYWGYPGMCRRADRDRARIRPGWALNNWASGGAWWGGGVNWGNRGIIANRPRVNPLGGANWQRPGGSINPTARWYRTAAEHRTASCGERPGAGQQPR